MVYYMRIITFKIDEELLMYLDMLVSMKKMSRSKIIREALEEYIVKNIKLKNEPLIVLGLERG